MTIYKKYIIYIVLSCFMVITAYGDDFKLKRKIQAEGNFLNCDALGNIYIANDYELILYGPDGTLLFTYTNYLAGNITFVDPSDPFKVLVYYRDFGQIEVLDNYLSPSTDPILLQAYGLELTTLVCRSYNSGMWVYNSQDFELLRINENMQITDRTGNLSMITGQDVNPNYLIENEGMLYLNDPEIGIMVFDKYGTYYNTYTFTGINEFQVHSNRIIYVIGQVMYTYNIVKLIETKIALPVQEHQEAKISFDRHPPALYMLKNSDLFIFEKNE